LQYSVYNFEKADVSKLWQHFDLYEAEGKALLDEYHAATRAPKKGAENSVKFTASERKRFPVLAAFDLTLKCSHLFNILDARGAISVTERVGIIARVRALAVAAAKAWVSQQQGAVEVAAEASA
jgi:glycyl-tRNA synthetase alpha chain